MEDSPHPNLRPLVKVLGTRSLITPKVLQLARWIADYYCCRLEVALRSVLPESVRQEKEGWRQRLVVRAISSPQSPELTERQAQVWKIVEEWRELHLKELIALAGTTAETVRRLEDKGLVTIGPQIDERDPYGHEHILPTQPLPLNPEQADALSVIRGALEINRRQELPGFSSSMA